MRTFYIFLFGLSITSLSSQDIHYSQFYNSHTFVNPTLFSIQSNDHTLQLQRRSQWYTVTTPFSTTSFTYGGKNIYKGFSAAITSLNDIAGDSRLSTSAGLISISNKVSINKGVILYGIQPSFYQQSINYANLFFLQDEPLKTQSLSFLDLSLGLSYQNFIDLENSFLLGFSAYHINKPNQSFSQNNTFLLPVKFNYYTSIVRKINSKNILTPSVFYSSQKEAREFIIGCHLNHIINNEIQITTSIFNRYNDALIFAVGLINKNIKFEASYDVNTSSLRNASNSVGAVEFSISYGWNKNKKNNKEEQIICPKYL